MTLVDDVVTAAAGIRCLQPASDLPGSTVGADCGMERAFVQILEYRRVGSADGTFLGFC